MSYLLNLINSLAGAIDLFEVNQMRCPVCGQTYGLTHNCSGIAPAVSPQETAPAPPHAIPIVHYFLEAWRIARWDDVAIRRASQDNGALLFGAIFLGMGILAVLAVPSLPAILGGARVNWPMFVLNLLLWTLLFGIITLAQYGICHWLAKRLFDASGTYFGVLRPLLLGSVVQWFIVIPVVGILIGGLWGIAVLMFVFEEVDGIERMQAFGLSFVVGIAFRILLGMLLRGV